MRLFGISATTIIIVLVAYAIGAKFPVLAQRVGLA